MMRAQARLLLCGMIDYEPEPPQAHNRLRAAIEVELTSLKGGPEFTFNCKVPAGHGYALEILAGGAAARQLG